MYRANEWTYHPEFVVHVLNDSVARLYTRIKPDEFLFIRQNDNSFQATVTVLCEVIRSYDDVRLLDTASVTYRYDINEKNSSKVIELIVPLKEKTELILHVRLLDGNKGYSEYYFVPVDHSGTSGRNDFLLTNQEGEPLFKNYINATDSILVKYRDENVKSLYCKMYKREFALPPPPFGFNVHTEFDYHPDSLFLVSVNSSQAIVLSGEGFYHLQSDTSKKPGLTVYRYCTNFPLITTPQQMIDQIRYLTNKKEFEELKKKEPVKSGVDEFWLTRGSRNEEKTRTLIKKYYSRVQEANRLFSSHVEGWKTDRGMIHLVFGSPTTVFKSEGSETWIYGTASSPLSVNFFFVKVDNPFTVNDYMLSRAPIYESSWYRAVEIWRQGRPYNSFY